MVNKKVILLASFKYHYQNRLTKYIKGGTTISTDLYYYKPLQKIFSKVIGYDYPQRLVEIGVKGINEEIIELVKKERPDYVIWTAGGYEFQESTFDAIRKEGTTVVGFFYDDEYRFDEYSKWWISYLDYCVTNAIEAVSKYKALNAKCILAVPIMGGMRVDRDWSNLRERYDVSFVGNKDSVDREQYIKALQKRNVPIHLFGGNRGGGYISIEEMLDIYGSSKINLSFTKTGCVYNKAIKGRIFEVCLAGGFLLTEYVPGLENYFEIGKEIACFRNSEGMIDKINYYLDHNEERQAIAKAGWEKAIANYTSFHILSKIFKQTEKDIMAGLKKDSSFVPMPKMPRKMRKNFSNCYFHWGLAFAMEGYKKLWKDALFLSLSYNSFNVRTWYCYFIGFSPSFVRPVLFRLYKILKKYFN